MADEDDTTTPDPLSDLKLEVSSLRETVETLANTVQGLSAPNDDDTRDVTPTGRPWTARGRR